MEISIFEAVGRIMVGPSSSHTAGAARLGRMAAKLVGQPFTHVDFGLHGSFAKTYQGHGTDLALVAGVLGMYQDDENLSKSFEIAKEKGITYHFYETEISGAHENTVCMSFLMQDGHTREIIGSSVGGGQIKILSIDGFPLEMSLNMTTLLVINKDTKGIVYQVTRSLAANDINIANMKLTRQQKGAMACCVIETDSEISDFVLRELKEIPGVQTVKLIN